MQSLQLAQAIQTQAKINNLDWRLIVAIFFQESSLSIDPQGCLASKKRCTADYGIGQVRAKVWEKAFPIDRKKLMSDVHYSVQTSVKVLTYYKMRYAQKELNWFTRYHSGSPIHRATYMKNLNKAFAKINKHLKDDEVRLVAATP